jgi:hypothetical protein
MENKNPKENISDQFANTIKRAIGAFREMPDDLADHEIAELL